MNANLTAEEKFWNDPKNIEWFRKEPAAPYWKEFFESVDKAKIKKVLDLGSGAGRNSEMLAILGFDIYACDLHEEMVKETKRRLHKEFPNKTWDKKVIQASMLDLPYEDSSFDAIIANGIYHNVTKVSEMEWALKESSRILRKGGYLCFNLFTSKCIADELKQIPNESNAYFTAEGLYMVLVSSEEFLKMAKDNGLKLEGELVEYEREVSTGKRSIARGILSKI